MARLSRTEKAILGFLTWGPMSGYDIKQAVDASIGHFWNESYGQIYPILKRLAVSGLVAADEPRASGGRPSEAYRLTEEGRLELSDWLAQPAEPEPKRNELLLKLFFGRSNPPEVNIHHVERRREQAAARLKTYGAIKQDIRRHHGQHPELPYWLMTLSYGEHALRAQVAWCDETLCDLNGLATAAHGTDAESRGQSPTSVDVNRGDPS